MGQNLNHSLIVKEKWKRLAFFIELVKQLSLPCKTAQEAYIHLTTLLQRIEERHAPPNEGKMLLNPLNSEDFRFDPNYGIYYSERTRHIVFIHKDGAYAIHDKKDAEYIDWEYYRYNPIPLINQTNIYGKNIWS